MNTWLWKFLGQEVTETMDDFSCRIPGLIWDRWIRTDNEILVYGWIPRKDKERDFILVRSWLDLDTEMYWFDTTTSSAKYSEQISQWFGDGQVHNKCRPVAELYKESRYCDCHEDDRRGDTAIWCCNHCGKPTERYW